MELRGITRATDPALTNRCENSYENGFWQEVELEI